MADRVEPLPKVVNAEAFMFLAGVIGNLSLAETAFIDAGQREHARMAEQKITELMLLYRAVTAK